MELKSLYCHSVIYCSVNAPSILFPSKGVSGFAPYRKDYLLKMALGKEGQEEQVNTQINFYSPYCVFLL